jgi:hypothetical protein
MTLPKDESELFEDFVGWLYRRKIETPDRNIWVIAYFADVYIFADKYFCNGCQNAIVDHSQDYLKEFPSILDDDDMEIAFKKTAHLPPITPIKRFCAATISHDVSEAGRWSTEDASQFFRRVQMH